MTDEKPLHWPLLLPLLVTVVLTQTIISLARLSLVYLAIDEHYDAPTVGAISACYALLPIFLSVVIGRFSDRGGYSAAAIGGTTLVLFAAITGHFVMPSVPALIASNVLLGMGHMLLVNSSQFMLTKASSPAGRDSAIGYFMIAAGTGHATGPLIVSALSSGGDFHPPDALLVCIGGAVALLAVTSLMFVLTKRTPHPAIAARSQVGDVLRSIPLRWIVLTSAICVGASDLLLIFLPILGTERGIDPAVIGILLALRSFIALPVRVVFGWLVRRLGRRRLLSSSMIVAGLGFVGLLFPAPFPVLAIVVMLSGIGLGLAVPATLSLTYLLAPPGAVGIVTSLRTTSSRLSQFFVPLLAGLLAAASGTVGVFLVIGLALGAGAVGGYRALPADHPKA